MSGPFNMTPHSRIAVIGSGISGLASAWLLRDHAKVTLFEAGSYFGGHSNTVDVSLEGMTYPVDTGFLVHNDLTYPNLIQLFEHLKIPVHASDMSFGVSIEKPDIEWAGTNLGTVFAQRSNVLKPKFLMMLRDILRFNRQAQHYLDRAQSQPETLGELLTRERFGQPMRDWYLLPMAAAIWSASVKDILDFPATTFLSFCLNHRLLQIENRPQWKTVIGGSRTYVKAMIDDLNDTRLDCPVYRVQRENEQVIIHSAQGIEHFDAVIFACHAPTALALLESTPDEKKVLESFRYQSNRAILHIDTRLLPRRKKVWSAWNYLSVGDERSHAQDETRSPVAVSYLLNQLQPLPFKTPVIVTLNPLHEPDPKYVLRTFQYEHPVLNQAAADAQKCLPLIQGTHRAWFCGAWSGFGFHEDGLKSALRVVRDFEVPVPWTPVYD